MQIHKIKRRRFFKKTKFTNRKRKTIKNLEERNNN